MTPGWETGADIAYGDGLVRFDAFFDVAAALVHMVREVSVATGCGIYESSGSDDVWEPDSHADTTARTGYVLKLDSDGDFADPSPALVAAAVRWLGHARARPRVRRTRAG